MLDRLKVTLGPYLDNLRHLFGSFDRYQLFQRNIKGKKPKPSLNLHIQRICNASDQIYIINTNSKVIRA